MRSTAPFAVSAAPSRVCGRWLRAPVCRARRFGYSNDAAGRRTAISRSGEAFGDLSGSTDAYGYNSRSEVVSARRTKGGASVRGFDEDFSYDPIGNRIATTNYDETGSAIVSEYTANSLNQYTSRTVPGVAAVRGFADADATVTVNENPAYRLGEYFFGSDEFDNSQSAVDAALVTAAALASPTNGSDEVASVTSRVHIAKSPQLFEYDLDGNQTLVATKTGTWRVTYNGENRPVLWERVAADSNTLTLTSNTQTRVSMSFDHQGRRRSYIEVSADGSTNHIDHFTYDNYLCVARNRWQPGGTIATDRFVWDPTEPVATRPLAFHQPNAPPMLYAHDGNKNVSELVSSADGSISAHYEYAPFGEVILSSGDFALTNPFRFSSEYADDSLDLVYYNYRHLEPVTGRWLNVDIIEDAGGVNMYALSKNSLNLDRLGLKECVLSQMDVDPAGWVLAEYSFGRKEALNGFVFVDEIVSKWELKAKVQCCCWQWNWGWGNKPKIIRSEISKFVEKRQSLDQVQRCIGYTPTGPSSIPSPTTITAVFGEIGAQLISKGVSSAMVFFTETDARRLAAQIMAMRPSSIQEGAWPWDKCK